MGLFHQNSFWFLNYSRFSKTFYIYFILILALQSGLQLVFKKCKQHLETGLSDSTELWAVNYRRDQDHPEQHLWCTRRERQLRSKGLSVQGHHSHRDTWRMPTLSQCATTAPHGIDSGDFLLPSNYTIFWLHCYCSYFLYMNQSIFNYKTNQQVLGKMNHVFLLVRILGSSWLSFYWAAHTLPLNKFSLFAS